MNARKPVGDQHHFGRAVSFGEWQGIPAVFKPRSTEWEQLFFSKAGVLSIFKDTRFRTPIASLSQIDCLMEEAGESVIRRLETAKISPPSHVLWVQFAILSALSTTFGISDLLGENLIVTNSGLCPIDVECVLQTDVRLSSSGLLIPSNGPASISGVYSLVKSCEGAGGFDLSSLGKVILATFESFMLEIQSQKDQLDVFFSELRPRLEKVPVRIMLRNTTEYADALAASYPFHELVFIPEEIVQLRRGDIPYFFSYPDSDEILSYTTADLQTAMPILRSPNQVSIFSMPIVPDENMFSRDRLVQELTPTGLLCWADTILAFAPHFAERLPMDVGAFKIEARGRNLFVSGHGCEWMQIRDQTELGKTRALIRIA